MPLPKPYKPVLKLHSLMSSVLYHWNKADIFKFIEFHSNITPVLRTVLKYFRAIFTFIFTISKIFILNYHYLILIYAFVCLNFNL